MTTVQWLERWAAMGRWMRDADTEHGVRRQDMPPDAFDDRLIRCIRYGAAVYSEDTAKAEKALEKYKEICMQKIKAYKEITDD